MQIAMTDYDSQIVGVLLGVDDSIQKLNPFLNNLGYTIEKLSPQQIENNFFQLYGLPLIQENFYVNYLKLIVLFLKHSTKHLYAAGSGPQILITICIL